MNNNIYGPLAYNVYGSPDPIKNEINKINQNISNNTNIYNNTENVSSNTFNGKIDNGSTQINNSYKSLVDLTSSIFDINTNDRSVTINKSKFIIDTELNEIRLDDHDNPTSMILFNTTDASGLSNISPNGSLFLTQNNEGEGYLKRNNRWKKIKKDNIVIDYNNISGNLTINDNYNLNIYDNLRGFSNLNLDTENSIISSDSIITNDIYTNRLKLSNNINCSGVINSNNITSYGTVMTNTLKKYNNNSVQVLNIDNSGNLDTSGNISTTGIIYLKEQNLEDNNNNSNIKDITLVNTHIGINDSYNNSVLMLIGLDDISNTTDLVNYTKDKTIKKTLLKGTVEDLVFTISETFPTKTLFLNKNQYYYYPGNTNTKDVMNFYNNGGTIEFMFQIPEYIYNLNDEIIFVMSSIDADIDWFDLTISMNGSQPRLYIRLYNSNSQSLFQGFLFTNQNLTSLTWYSFVLCFDKYNNDINCWIGSQDNETLEELFTFMGDHFNDYSNNIDTAQITFGASSLIDNPNIRFGGSIGNIKITPDVKYNRGDTIPFPTEYTMTTTTGKLDSSGNIISNCDSINIDGNISTNNNITVLDNLNGNSLNVNSKLVAITDILYNNTSTLYLIGLDDINNTSQLINYATGANKKDLVYTGYPLYFYTSVSFPQLPLSFGSQQLEYKSFEDLSENTLNLFKTGGTIEFMFKPSRPPLDVTSGLLYIEANNLENNNYAEITLDLSFGSFTTSRVITWMNHSNGGNVLDFPTDLNWNSLVISFDKENNKITIWGGYGNDIPIVISENNINYDLNRFYISFGYGGFQGSLANIRITPGPVLYPSTQATIPKPTSYFEVPLPPKIDTSGNINSSDTIIVDNSIECTNLVTDSININDNFIINEYDLIIPALYLVGLDDTNNVTSLENYTQDNNNKNFIKNTENNLVFETSETFPQLYLNFNFEQLFYYPSQNDLSDVMNFYNNGGTIEFMYYLPINETDDESIISIRNSDDTVVLDLYHTNSNMDEETTELIILIKDNSGNNIYDTSYTINMRTWYYLVMSFDKPKNKFMMWLGYGDTISQVPQANTHNFVYTPQYENTPSILLGGYNLNNQYLTNARYANIRFSSNVLYSYMQETITKPTSYFTTDLFVYNFIINNINTSGTFTANNVNVNSLQYDELDINSKMYVDSSGNIDTSGTINASGSIISPSGINVNSKLNINTLNNSDNKNVNVLLLVGLDDTSNVESLTNYALESKRKTLTKGTANDLTFVTSETFPQLSLNFNNEQSFYYLASKTSNDTMNFMINGGTIQFMFKTSSESNNIFRNQSIFRIGTYIHLSIYNSNINISINTGGGPLYYTNIPFVREFTWYHFVLTIDIINNKILVWFGSESDNILIQLNPDQSDIFDSFISQTYYIMIGASAINNSNKFYGEMANIRFTPDILYPYTQLTIPKPMYYFSNNLIILDTSGTINASGNINTSGSITSNTLNVNSKLNTTIVSKTNVLLLVGLDNTSNLTSLENYAENPYKKEMILDTSNNLHFVTSQSFPQISLKLNQNGNQSIYYPNNSDSTDTFNFYKNGGTIEFMFKTGTDISSEQIIFTMYTPSKELYIRIVGERIYFSFSANTDFNRNYLILESKWYYCVLSFDKKTDSISLWFTEVYSNIIIRLSSVYFSYNYTDVESYQTPIIIFGSLLNNYTSVFTGEYANIRLTIEIDIYKERTIIITPVSYFTNYVDSTLNTSGSINASGNINTSGSITSNTLNVNSKLNTINKVNVLFLVGLDDTSNVTSIVNYAQNPYKKEMILDTSNNLHFVTSVSFPQLSLKLNQNGPQTIYYPNNSNSNDTFNFYKNGGTIEFMFKTDTDITSGQEIFRIYTPTKQLYVGIINDRCQFFISINGVQNFNNSIEISTSTWYYCVFSFDKPNNSIMVWFGENSEISQIPFMNNTNFSYNYSDTLEYQTPSIFFGSKQINNTYLFQGEYANIRLISETVLYPYTQETITKPTSYYNIINFDTSGTINTSGNIITSSSINSPSGINVNSKSNIIYNSSYNDNANVLFLVGLDNTSNITELENFAPISKRKTFTRIAPGGNTLLYINSGSFPQKSLKFNGQVFEYPRNADTSDTMNFYNNGGTIEFMVKFNSLYNNYSQSFFKIFNDESGSYLNLILELRKFGSDLYINITDITQTVILYDYNTAIPVIDDIWYHTVISFDKPNGKLMVWFGSGSTISQITDVTNNLTYSSNNTQMIHIGEWSYNGYHFSGEIANMRFTSDVLYPYTQTTITKPTSYYSNTSVNFDTSGTINASGSIITSGSIISSSGINVNSKLNIIYNSSYNDNANVLFLVGLDNTSNVTTLENYAPSSKIKTFTRRSPGGNTLLFINSGSFPQKSLNFNGQQTFYYDTSSNNSDSMNFFANGGTIEFMFKANVNGTDDHLLTMSNYNIGGINLKIILNNNQLIIFMNTVGGNILYFETYTINLSIWYYLVMSFDKPNNKVVFWFGSDSTISLVPPYGFYGTNDYNFSLNITTIIIGGESTTDTTKLFLGEMVNIRFTPDIIYPYTQTTITKPTSYYSNTLINFNTSGSINTSGTINNLALTANATGFSISGGTTDKTLTVNRTLTFSGTDSTTMTFPTTSQSIAGLTSSQSMTNKTITLNAGTTTVAPLRLTWGTNLTSASNGAIEYSEEYFATPIDCNSVAVRKYLPTYSYYRIDSDYTNSSYAGSGALVFPISIDIKTSSHYIVEWHLFWNRTVADTHLYHLVASKGFIPMYDVDFFNVQTVGVTTTGVGTTMDSDNSLVVFLPSPTLAIGNHYHIIKAVLRSKTSGPFTPLNLYVTPGTSNTTKLLRGSHVIIQKVPYSDNYGVFS